MCSVREITFRSLCIAVRCGKPFQLRTSTLTARWWQWTCHRWTQFHWSWTAGSITQEICCWQQTGAAAAAAALYTHMQMQAAHSLTHRCSLTIDSPSPFDRCLDVLFVCLVLFSFEVVCTLVIDHTSFLCALEQNICFSYNSLVLCTLGMWCHCRINSGLRSQLLPSCQPTYSGYLAWQGVALLEELSPEAQVVLGNKSTLYKASSEGCSRAGTTILGGNVFVLQICCVRLCCVTDMLCMAMQLQNCSVRCSF